MSELPAVDALPSLPPEMRSWTKRSANGNGNGNGLVAKGEAIPPGGGMHNHLWDYGLRLVTRGVTDVATLEAAVTGEHALRRVPGADYGDEASLRKHHHAVAVDLANGTVAQAVISEQLSVVTEPEDEAAAAVSGIPDYPSGVFKGRVQAQFDNLVDNGIAPAHAAAALLGAVATVIGKSRRARVGAWEQYPALWLPIVGPPSSKKSPALQIAFAPIFAEDARLGEQYDAKLREYVEWSNKTKAAKEEAGELYRERPVEKQLTAGNTTLEAFLCTLYENDETLAFVIDEMSGLMEGMGQYKSGASSDWAWFLELWTGVRIKYQRRGNSKNGQNGINFRYERPVVSVVGTMTYSSVPLLGGIASGLAPRFLLHASNPSLKTGVAGTLDPYRDLIDELNACRNDPDPARGDRCLPLSDDARELFDAKRAEWAERAQDLGPSAEAAALGKADTNTLREAVVLAEMDAPGTAELISVDVIERAIKDVEFSVACWREMPSVERLAISHQDKALDDGVDGMRAWLRGRGWVGRRPLQRASVCGARTAKQMALLLDRYQDTHPNKVRENPDSNAADKREFHE